MGHPGNSPATPAGRRRLRAYSNTIIRLTPTPSLSRSKRFDLLNLQAMGEQLVDRQAGAEECDHARRIETTQPFIILARE
jgi:hypothetical protein